MHSKLWSCEAAAAAGQVRLGSDQGCYKSPEDENVGSQGCREPGWISGEHPALSGFFILTDN